MLYVALVSQMVVQKPLCPRESRGEAALLLLVSCATLVSIASVVQYAWSSLRPDLCVVLLLILPKLRPFAIYKRKKIGKQHPQHQLQAVSPKLCSCTHAA